jgi:hypothetical protein
VQKTLEKAPQVVEVVGADDIDVILVSHFLPFGNCFDAKDNNRHFIADLRPFTNTNDGRNEIERRFAKTDQNQIGTLATGLRSPHLPRLLPPQ